MSSWLQGNFSGGGCFSDCGVLGMWWEACFIRGLVENEAERPTRLLSRGAVAEKVNVLPEAALGLPCPSGKDVSLWASC